MGKSRLSHGGVVLVLLASFCVPTVARASGSKPTVVIDLDRKNFASVSDLYVQRILKGNPPISNPDLRPISVRSPAALYRWLGKAGYGGSTAYLRASDGFGFLTRGTRGIWFFPVLAVGLALSAGPGQVPMYSVLMPVHVGPADRLLRVRNLTEEEAWYLAGLLRYPAAIGDLLTGDDTGPAARLPGCNFSRRKGEPLEGLLHRMGVAMGFRDLARVSGSVLVNDAYYNGAANTLIAAGGYALGTCTGPGCLIGAGLCCTGIAVGRRPPTRKAGLQLTLWDEAPDGWSRKRDVGIRGLTFAEACYVKRLFEDLPTYRGLREITGPEPSGSPRSRP